MVDQVARAILRVGVAAGIGRQHGEPLLDERVRLRRIRMRAKEIVKQQCVPPVRTSSSAITWNSSAQPGSGSAMVITGPSNQFRTLLDPVLTSSLREGACSQAVCHDAVNVWLAVPVGGDAGGEIMR